MTGANVVRAFVGLLGVLLLAAGVALAVGFAGSGGVFAGFWLIVGGGALLIGVLIERTRYRSQAAERDQLSPGPGGGETGPPDPRFQRTDEVFVDPTTHLQMRVYLDPTTGERRYLAEG
jgi:hypothetical protein